MLTGLVVIIHVLVALSLIMIILLQTGKGAGMGAAFGGSSQTLFGSTGRANFLTKITIAAAVIFTLTSVGLSLMQGGPKGVMKDFETPAATIPTVPELPPASQDSLAPGAAAPGTELPPAAGPDGAAAPAPSDAVAPVTPAPAPEPGAAPTPDSAPTPAPPPETPAAPPPPAAPSAPPGQ